MSIFEKDFLNRVKSRRVSAKAQEPATAENVPLVMPDMTEQLAREARAPRHGGPLVIGPARSSLKHSWRDDARWPEENVPEEFGLPRNQPSSAPCVERSLCPGLVDSAPREEPQCPPVTPESSQRAPEALPAPPPIPPLPGSFWQAVLYGNPEGLIPGKDATQALYLLSAKLGIAIAKGETLETLRAGQLRKMLRDRFGATAAEGALATLWRSAPASSGVPQPAEDQSRLPPGPFPVGRAQPAWIRDLHDPDRCEREWLLDHGIG
jgi:hypothetical protein